MSLKCKDQSLDVKLKSSGMSCDHSVLGSSLIRALLVACIKYIFQGSGWFPPLQSETLGEMELFVILV